MERCPKCDFDLTLLKSYVNVEGLRELCDKAKWDTQLTDEERSLLQHLVSYLDGQTASLEYHLRPKETEWV